MKLPDIYILLPDAILEIARSMFPDELQRALPSKQEKDSLQAFITARDEWERRNQRATTTPGNAGLGGLAALANLATTQMPGTTVQAQQPAPEPMAMPVEGDLVTAARRKKGELDELLSRAWTVLHTQLINGRMQGFAFVAGHGVEVSMLMWGIEPNVNADKTKKAVASLSSPAVVGDAYLVRSEVKRLARTFLEKKNYGEGHVFAWAERQFFQPAVRQEVGPVGWREFYAAAQKDFRGIRKPVVETVWDRRPRPPFVTRAPKNA